MRTLNRTIAVLDKTAAVIVITLMASMGVIAFTAVFFRFVLNDPLSWSEEAARYMMAWVTFMGAGLAMGQRRHIGVTLIVSKFPERMRLFLNLTAEVVILLFLGLIAWQGAILVWDLKTQVSPAMHFPMIIPYLSVPAGCLYMALQVVKLMFEKTTGTLSTADTELAADDGDLP